MYVVFMLMSYIAMGGAPLPRITPQVDNKPGHHPPDMHVWFYRKPAEISQQDGTRILRSFDLITGGDRGRMVLHS